MHAVTYKYANRKWSLFAVIEVVVLVRIANQLALWKNFDWKKREIYDVVLKTGYDMKSIAF